ncbi:hypothetical protein [Sphingomonas mesophila]|uniref:hypothetical protein n=1 Tax=Sphingomonas mesophila TaxID=2303576 RepID=UPI0013C351FD|nr:hypothetical protein [Sphingomonas mesophila]
MRPNVAFSIGLAASVASAVLWHGPGGAADRFIGRSEAELAQMLDYFEMRQVSGRVQRDPVARRIVLRGPADDFQRRELVRLSEDIPGIGEARWSPSRSLWRYPLPMIVEAIGLAIAAFLIGLTTTAIVFYARREPL